MKLIDSFRSWRMLAAAPLLIGAAVLATWCLPFRAPRGLPVGGVGMNPLTAIALVLAGVGLLASRESRPRSRFVMTACGVLLAALGALRLGAMGSFWTLRIDALIFAERVRQAGSAWMGPLTAAACVTLGISIALTAAGTARLVPLRQILLLLTAFVTAVALMGYGYGESFLHGPMAAITAVGFLLAALAGLGARPEAGIAALLGGRGPAAALARRLIPAIVAMPALLGWLALLGVRSGSYSVAGGTAAFAVATMVTLATVAWWSLRRLERAEAAGRRAEGSLRESEERFRALATTANDAIVSANAAGRITFLNPAAERIFGCIASDALGQSITALMPERFHEAHAAGLNRFLATGERRVIGRTVELVARRREGSEFPIDLSLATWEHDGEAQFTAVIRDITERKAAELELKRYASELESANAELDAFAHSVSHDLRAPLRHIDGFGQALERTNANRLDDEGREHLQRIRSATRRMTGLIDSLLELSRVTRTPLDRRPVDLSAMAREIVDDLAGPAAERRIEWHIPAGITARADAGLMRIALVNLLSNAWKYTRERNPARIELGCAGDGDEPIFFVRDNGAGFEMAYVEKLFAPFQRLHSAKEFEGAGVGLATVARIIHRHGGRIWAEGTVGEGAKFSFTL